MAGQGRAWWGVARQGLARRGAAGLGAERQGLDWQGKACIIEAAEDRTQIVEFVASSVVFIFEEGNMGERSIDSYLTLDDLERRYGWTRSFFYKHSHALDAAKLKLNGKPIRPFRFDPDVLDQLIKAGPNEKQPTKAARRLKARSKIARAESKDKAEDELWQ